jgi:hypothetical protein
MALKLKKQLSTNGIKFDISFQPIIEIIAIITSSFKTNSMISTSVFNTIEDFKNKNTSNLFDIEELKCIRNLNIGTPDANNSGVDVLEKFNLYLNNIVKTNILANNPTWVDSDIEILNINTND